MKMMKTILISSPTPTFCCTPFFPHVHFLTSSCALSRQRHLSCPLRATSSGSSSDSITTERSEADKLVDGMDFGELCNEFECISSPSIESTARQLARDILELRQGNRALGTFAVSVKYKDPLRSFTGREKYKRPLWVTDALDNPSVTVQEMVMLSTSVLRIRWTIKGRPKSILSSVGGDLIVKVNSQFTLNQISGQVIEHEEFWDLSASSAISQAFFWTSRQLYSTIEAGKDVAEFFKNTTNRITMEKENVEIYPDPSGDPTKVIGINGQFPGPILNVTTNWNVVVNVKNHLDEPFLLTWNGIQHRKNSWQDGVSGTTCPIPAGWNFTYQFQVKDQIGSFFYFPSLDFQKASGGYGGITINNREVIPVPFGTPDGDITVFISDWYIKSHKELRKELEDGIDLGVPDGVLFNGFGPYRYDVSLVPGGIPFETINVEPGKTYRLRVHNVGISTSLNFRIQDHNLLLVETEGSYTVQQNYTNMDIHVGQSYSFLVTMDQNASSDYYMVASARFANLSSMSRGTGVAILHYSNSQGPAAGPLPDPPNELDTYFSMNQARTIRWNVSAGAARPNPQGSFRYGDITVTEVFVLLNRPAELIDGKWATTLNGISYVPPATPLKLAQQFDIPGVFKLDFPNRMMNRPAKFDTSIINGSYRGFMEIIFQNNDSIVQSYHLDGYAFFVVGMDFGIWTENSRGTYNKWDGVARCTTQVFPGAWTAILVSLDNVGMWNLRAQNLNSWYLGQEVYVSVVNPEISNKTELPLPDNAIYCGLLTYLQKTQSHKVSFSGAETVCRASRRMILVALFLTWCGGFL